MEIKLPSLNWTCNICGRTFARIDTTRRHIEKIHNGNGGLVRYSDYVAGIKTGIYKPTSAQTMNRGNENKIKTTFTNAFYDEIGRQAARSFYEKQLAKKPISVTCELIPAIHELLFDNEVIDQEVKRALQTDFINEYGADSVAKVKQLKEYLKNLNQMNENL